MGLGRPGDRGAPVRRRPGRNLRDPAGAAQRGRDLRLCAREAGCEDEDLRLDSDRVRRVLQGER